MTMMKVGRMYDHDLPRLKGQDISAETMALFELQFRAWAGIHGLLAYTVGPPLEAPTDPRTLEVHKSNLQEGLKYVCHAIEDESLKASISLRSNLSGIQAFNILRADFLEGRQVQPVLMNMLRRMTLDMGASPQVFKNNWLTYAEMLSPQPPASEMYEYFTHSIAKETDGFYDHCIDTIGYNLGTPTDGYHRHVTALSKMMQEKKTREASLRSSNKSQTVLATSTRPIGRQDNRRPSGPAHRGASILASRDHACYSQHKPSLEHAQRKDGSPPPDGSPPVKK